MPPHRPVQNVPNDGRRVNYPTHDNHGQPLGGTYMNRAPGTAIVNRTVNNVTIINTIHQRVGMGSQLQRGQYYWFNHDGYRWSHHYDSYGLHWFGFYMGDVYFWTRYHDGRLWWDDVRWGRSLYYRDGFWWWQNGTVVYIYRDGAYLRYTPVRGGYEARPDPPTSEPEHQDQTSFYSADATRLVQVMGQRREAFLYDNAGETPAFLAYLAAGVEEVQFAEGGQGGMQILCVTRDENGQKTFKLFDGNGTPVGAPTDTVNPEAQLKESGSFNTLQGGTESW